MGLDIIAYEHATLIEDHTTPVGEWCEHTDGDEHAQAYVYTTFVPSAAGLQLIGNQGSIAYGRCYRLHGRIHDFRAGSYGGYNAWRDALAGFAATLADTRPNEFRLLTYFADNEGWIGPEAAAVLAEQFERNADAAKAHLAERADYWVEKYDDWTESFKLAAGTGVVVFA